LAGNCGTESSKNLSLSTTALSGLTTMTPEEHQRGL